MTFQDCCWFPERVAVNRRGVRVLNLALRDISLGPLRDLLFAVPTSYVLATDGQLQTVNVRGRIYEVGGLGGGLLRIQFVMMEDFIVAFDAGDSCQTAPSAISAIRRIEPKIPIRYAVMSPFHNDHSGGLAAHFDAGATIMGSPAEQDVYARYAAARSEFQGKAAAPEGLDFKLTPVGTKGYEIVDAAGRKLKVLSLSGASRVDRLLARYAPEAKAIITVDFYSALVRFNDSVSSFARRLRQGKLPVYLVLGSHDGLRHARGATRARSRVSARPGMMLTRQSSWDATASLRRFQDLKAPLRHGHDDSARLLPRTAETRTARLLATILALSVGQAATAQTALPPSQGRTQENAVIQAEDAFGSSIGNEQVGIYSAADVRGFSPTRAGNVRIEGLYFDQVSGISSQLRRSNSIRIGLTALGYPFPAPTGIVDYGFRKPGNQPTLSAAVSADTYGAVGLELDAALPLVKDKLSFGVGLGLHRNTFYNGTDSLQHFETLQLRWTPSTDVEISPFWARSDIYDLEIGSTYVPAGSFLPPKIQRRRKSGPEWARYEGASLNYGATARFDLSPNWQVRAGIFRSLFDNDNTISHLLADLSPDGRGRRQIFVEPSSLRASTSGELRLSRRVADGPRLHKFHLTIRTRDRRFQFGGIAPFDLGPTTINDVVTAFMPTFAFVDQSFDHVRQWTGGLAYEGRWKGIGELSFGIQKTDYTKLIQQPGLPDNRTESAPWLFNLAAAVYLSESFALYGSYTRGLEESGIAPSNATNRGEALQAIRTEQKDIGIRWAIAPKMSLVAGLFDIRKPYFNLDAAGRFDLLGDTRNRGVEFSLSGQLTKKLRLLLGAVLSKPEVTGEGVTLGRLGPIPVGQAARKIDFNIDWQPPILEGLSLNLAVGHSGRIVSTRDNMVSIPARTLIDIGGRYGFELGKNRASLRLSVSNLFDVYGYNLRGAGAYDLIPGRVATFRLVTDF